MPKESRTYSVYKRVDGADRLVELISVEETYSQDRALDLAVERLPEADRPGDYAAVVGMKWKPWGEHVVKVTGWGEAVAPTPTPPVARDADGNAPLPGQTDLVEDVEASAAAKAALDGEPIPESEVAVDPIPHVITTDESTIEQAKAKTAEERARGAEEEKAALASPPVIEDVPSEPEAPRQVADGIAAVQERRRAAEEARRDEPPAPVNTPDFAPPADW